MTMEEMREQFIQFFATYDGLCDASEVVIDFCNIYATSYEEYMAMWEYLADAIQ